MTTTRYQKGYNTGLTLAEDEAIKIIMNVQILKSSNNDFNAGMLDALDDVLINLREKLERIVHVPA